MSIYKLIEDDGIRLEAFINAEKKIAVHIYTAADREMGTCISLNKDDAKELVMLLRALVNQMEDP